MKRILFFVIIVCLSLLVFESLSYAEDYPSISIRLPKYGQRTTYPLSNGQIADCGIASLAMVEAFFKGYGDNDDVVYEGVIDCLRINDNVNLAPVAGILTHGCDVIGYDYAFVEDIQSYSARIYENLRDGNPVLIYRDAPYFHWGVICGYNGSEQQIDITKFTVQNPTIIPNSSIGGTIIETLFDFAKQDLGKISVLLFRINGMDSIPKYKPTARIEELSAIQTSNSAIELSCRITYKGASPNQVSFLLWFNENQPYDFGDYICPARIYDNMYYRINTRDFNLSLAPRREYYYCAYVSWKDYGITQISERKSFTIEETATLQATRATENSFVTMPKNTLVPFSSKGAPITAYATNTLGGLEANEVKMIGNNVASYRVGDLWGVVLSDGTISTKPKYKGCFRCFCEQGQSLGDTITIAAFDQTGWYALSSTTGEVYGEHWGHSLDTPMPAPVDYGYTPIQQGDLWGYCAANGDIIIKPQYISASYPGMWQGRLYAWVQTCTGWITIDIEE